jgi:MscS family membrane protein
MEKKPGNIVLRVIKQVFTPFLMLILLILSKIVFSANIAHLLPAPLLKGLDKFFITIVAIVSGFLAQRVAAAVILLYRVKVTEVTETTLDDELIPLMRKCANIAIWIIVIITILPFYGVNINALITTIGVGSLAIALAAKDTISNIIAGFLIMIDRPFRKGDRIKIPSGEVVKVLNIGARRSSFISDEKSVIVVPNLDLSNSKIINYTYGEEYTPEKA